METKQKWLILNIGLPVLPLLLRGLLKTLMGHFNFETINSSELFFVIGIVALLISQDLRLTKVPLDNPDKMKERSDRSAHFLLLFIICVFCSASCEIFHVLVVVDQKEDYNGAYWFMSFLAYSISIYIIHLSLKTRNQFNLTSNFI